MHLAEGLIEGEGVVKSIENSKLPGVVLITIDLKDVIVSFDILKELVSFREGDKVKISLSKTRPEFEEGKDIVMWGYVMSRKKVMEKGKELNRLLISLWGYLLIVESFRKELFKSFKVMDRLYFKLSTAE